MRKSKNSSFYIIAFALVLFSNSAFAVLEVWDDESRAREALNNCFEDKQNSQNSFTITFNANSTSMTRDCPANCYSSGWGRVHNHISSDRQRICRACAVTHCNAQLQAYEREYDANGTTSAARTNSDNFAAGARSFARQVSTNAINARLPFDRTPIQNQHINPQNIQQPETCSAPVINLTDGERRVCCAYEWSQAFRDFSGAPTGDALLSQIRSNWSQSTYGRINPDICEEIRYWRRNYYRQGCTTNNAWTTRARQNIRLGIYRARLIACNCGTPGHPERWGGPLPSSRDSCENYTLGTGSRQVQRQNGINNNNTRTTNETGEGSATLAE